MSRENPPLTPQRGFYQSMRIAAVYLFPGQTNGRPRERFYVTDFSGAMLDANALRRAAIEAEKDISIAPHIYARLPNHNRNDAEIEIEIEITPHAMYGYRWWFRCPRCYSRRGKLYVVNSGPACRHCLLLKYSR